MTTIIPSSTSTAGDLDILRALDFDPDREHACEFMPDRGSKRECGQPATFLAYCPCMKSEGSALCDEHYALVRKRSRWSIWQAMRLEGMRFEQCGHTVPGWRVKFVPIR